MKQAGDFSTTHRALLRAGFTKQQAKRRPYEAEGQGRNHHRRGQGLGAPTRRAWRRKARRWWWPSSTRQGAIGATEVKGHFVRTTSPTRRAASARGGGGGQVRAHRLLVNNAASSRRSRCGRSGRSGGRVGPAHGVNVRGLARSKAVVPQMRKQASGAHRQHLIGRGVHGPPELLH